MNDGGEKMMNEELIARWHEEERAAKMRGWDFSHIKGRYEECGELPWDYRAAVLSRLSPDGKLLDIDTGGGEFLLSLGHPWEMTAATENYPPNAALCEKKLLPLGIDFRAASGKETLPFADEVFDVVIDRHGDYNAGEIYRVLKHGGVFLTQQVGAENDRALVELLLGADTPLLFPEQTLACAVKKFEDAGFSVSEAQEAFRPIRFFDVGALVWFARIIEWEFPNFSVKKSLPQLLLAQELLEENGCIEGMTHRFFLIAQKN